VENRQGEIDFAWKGTIIGTSQGTITFRMDGVARSTFLKNRIGFCVLHPAIAAGAPCIVEHMGGTLEKANLPVYIVPDQPVPPFAEMQAMSHEVMPGVWAEIRFKGDVFEMEDQRNWTDASYKTFCTPLWLPYPVEIRKDTRVKQSVTLTLKDERPAVGSQTEPVSTQSPSLTLTLEPASAVPLPLIGLGVASHAGTLSERELIRLKALHLHHLRVDLRLWEPDYLIALRRAAAQARALGIPLEAALFVSENGEVELPQLRRVLDEVMPIVGLWLIYPAKEYFGGGSPAEKVVTLTRKYLADFEPTALFGAGTNADFIFMQRTLPPFDQLDRVCFAINPQVHAFDNASIIESLETQSIAVLSARRLAKGLPVVVTPVTLKPRHNPYATGPIPPVTPGQLPPNVDVRQMSLLGAGWTLGSIKYLAEGGAHSITYYETTGWYGVMETEAGSPLPQQFPSLPGAVFPLYHILADVADIAGGEFTGGEVVRFTSSDPLKVNGLAIRKNDRMCALVANLSAEPQVFVVRGLGACSRVRYLDETNAEAAMRFPEGYRAQPGKLVQVSEEGLELELLPYAVVRIDP
jgi:hypothetical protein